MTLRIIQTGNSLPYSYPVDPTAEFQPGQIAQLGSLGNQIVCGVSDGTAPIGIIDDIKTNSFTSASINEEVIVPADGILGPNNTLISKMDIKKELNNPYIVPSSFISYNVDIELLAKNGVVVFLAGTPLNYSISGNGPDAIRTVVSYTYQIPSIRGDDSTFGSGRITVWFSRIMAQTDQYDTSVMYPLNSNLFVNEKGLLTTRQIGENYPAVALVTAPPSSIMPFLEFIFM